MRSYANWGRLILRLPPLFFLLILFIYPLVTIFDMSLRPDGILDLSGFSRIITSDYYLETLIFTIWQAFLSTILTVGLAIPCAYIFVKYDFPLRQTILSLSLIPFVLPTVVVATAFLTLIGESGLVNQILMQLFALEEAPIQIQRTLTMILIAHVFYNFAIALRFITSYWLNRSQTIEEAAQSLGAYGWRLWWYVRFPLLRPALLATSLIIFIFTFTSFGVILILGGVRFATLEVQIYNQAINIFNLPLAAALSIVQICIMAIMMTVYIRLQSNMPQHVTPRFIIQKKPDSITEWLSVGTTVLAITLLLFAPLFALIWQALTIGLDSPSLTYFEKLFVNERNSILFVPPLTAITNSLVFATFTAFLALFLGGVISFWVRDNQRKSMTRRALDVFFMLPLATSAVTLGLGYIVALDEPPLNLRSSWLIIPLAHTLIAIPFVLRTLTPALRNIPQSLPSVASTLGSSPMQVWRYIEMPLIFKQVIVAFVFAFTVSLGEFGASVFVARPDTPTIPIVVFRLLGQPNIDNYGQALAMSSILMVVCALSFIIIDRFRLPTVGDF